MASNAGIKIEMTFDNNRPLDPTSWHILSLLQEDARLSYNELGRRVGLTPPAVAERVRRMEDAGVIAGYHADVRPDKIGLPLIAIIRINAAGGRCAAVAGLATTIPEIVECHRITGNDSYIVKVAVADVAHLEALLDRLTPYGDLTTSIVLSSPVMRRSLSEPSKD
jgi:Lrp/AsnC family leucine-responsive transcriptional regulator